MRFGSFLENIDGYTVARQIIGRRDTSGTGADYTDFLVGAHRSRPERRIVIILRLVGSFFLDFAHMERNVVIDARAVFTTRLSTQYTGDRRACIVDGDHAERLVVVTASDKRVVLGNLLIDGTAAVFTRCLVAVVKREFRVGFTRPDFLAPAFLCSRILEQRLCQRSQLGKIDIAALVPEVRFRLLRHLFKASISAGFKECRRDSDGTDSRLQDGRHIQSVSSSRK